jgi:hypothetical protein
MIPRRNMEDAVIVEMRIYTIHIGKMAELVDLYRREGFPVQSRILGNCVGWYTTEFGPLNQIVHMWGYESFADRTRRRAELFQNQDWLAYLKKAQPLVASQESRVLVPTDFSPVR